MRNVQEILRPMLWLAIAPAAIWAAEPGGPVRSGHDQTIIPPSGAYRMVEVVLEAVGGDVRNRRVLRGGMRNGKLAIHSNLSVRDVVGGLEFTDDAVKGEFTATAQGQPSGPRLEVTATIADGQITGIWGSKDGRQRGTVSGRIVGEADLARSNAFTTQADWPCWSGPTTSLAATRCGLALLDDFNQARLVWKSEEPVPQGPGNALNYPNLAATNQTSGGGASVVVSGGKVFVSYFQPSGDEFRKDHTGKGWEQLEAVVAKWDPPGTISPFMKEKWLVKADDVMVCMDAATGKTLWKTIFAGTSLAQVTHKGGVVNNTPCVGDGRIFAMGPGGTVRAIDIATGRALWELPGMSAQTVMPWSGARNQCTSPIFAGGTLILPDHGSTLYGIDPATGAKLWNLPGMSSGFQVPAKWVHQGGEYVISLTAPIAAKSKAAVVANAICVEPRTGKVLWEIELPPNPNKGVSVFGDVLYVTAAGALPKGFVGFPQKNDGDTTNANGTCSAFRLSLQHAEPLWQSPATFAAGDAPPAANGRHVAVGGPKATCLHDAATGKAVATYSGAGPFNEGFVAFVEDRVILSHDGSHGHSDMTILGATPETFATKLCVWNQPHPQTTSYHNKFMTWALVEGRIFMRGFDGVYCYDLRKQAK